jgi:CRP-like cAMP-binding protein
MKPLKIKTKNDLLKQVPLFSALKSKSLNQIAKFADEVSVEAGRVLAKQGARGYEFIFIVEGKAKVERDGKIVNRLSANDFFGEISLIDNGKRTATVTAETDSRLLLIKSQYFSSLMKEVPGFEREIIMALCKYLRRALSEAV